MPLAPFLHLEKFVVGGWVGGWVVCEVDFSVKLRPKLNNKPFFLLKIEIHAQILNTEPFLCDLRGLRY